jgi:hypothetical protein
MGTSLKRTPESLVLTTMASSRLYNAHMRPTRERRALRLSMQALSESCPTAPAIPTQVLQCPWSPHTSQTTSRVACWANVVSARYPAIPEMTPSWQTCCSPPRLRLQWVLCCDRRQRKRGRLLQCFHLDAASNFKVFQVCTPPILVRSVRRFPTQTHYSRGPTVHPGLPLHAQGPLAYLVRGGSQAHSWTSPSKPQGFFVVLFLGEQLSYVHTA